MKTSKRKIKKKKKSKPLKMLDKKEHAEIIIQVGGISMNPIDILSIHCKIPKFMLRGYRGK